MPRTSLTTSIITKLYSLVFVHGLEGHPIHTWEKGSIVWPRDLLPEEVKLARIMSFGYEDDVWNFFSTTSNTGIIQHALNLL
jgi:hypothetical protein